MGDLGEGTLDKESFESQSMDEYEDGIDDDE